MANGFTRFWAWPAELKKSGILGINRRNVDYIFENNSRHRYPHVDNKLLTKEICADKGIPLPETYAILSTHRDCQRFGELIGDHQEFVIKPASGAAGRGILVILKRNEEYYFTPGGRGISWSDLRYHLSTILSGLYSLGGQEDEVIVEQRIVSHPTLMAMAIEGTPDIRVVIYRCMPVMAMLRLPTQLSGGRANLHQGAVAAAIDLATGCTFGGVCQNRWITHHPDTKQPIAGVQIPQWKELLDAAMSTCDALKLGYVGVDFMIDAESGPVMLEANARPGLAIQLANREGILPKLAFIDSLSEAQRTGDRRWEYISQLNGKDDDSSLRVVADG